MKKRFIPKNSPEGQMLQRMMNGGRYDLPRYQTGNSVPEDEFFKAINRFKPYDPLKTRQLETIQDKQNAYDEIKIKYPQYNNPNVRPVIDDQFTDAELRSMYGNLNIKDLQQNLKDKGFDPGAIDGIMGPRTIRALRQSINNISRTNTSPEMAPMYSDNLNRFIDSVSTKDMVFKPLPEYFEQNIPQRQSSRGNNIYGVKDWSSEGAMQDFKRRHANFFNREENKDWNPNRKGDTRRFQEWYNAEAKRRGTPIYFTGDKSFNKVDDKFGQYTFSAPTFVQVDPAQESILMERDNTYVAPKISIGSPQYKEQLQGTSSMKPRFMERDNTYVAPRPLYERDDMLSPQENPSGENAYQRNYQVEDSYMPSPGPVDMDYLGGLAMMGAMGLPFLIPEASALGATEAALTTAARQAAGQAARQAPNVIRNIPNTIPKGNPGVGGRFFQPRTPSSYGTRIGYQQGGETIDNEMMKQVLAEFMQTLPPEEQDAFVEQFMQMRPEEQQMVVQRIMEMLTQSEQGMGQQAMPDERAAMEQAAMEQAAMEQAAMEQAAMQQQGMMQDGGDIPTYLEFDRDMSNVEVEGGETAMLPDGGLFRFEGPKHAQGGVPTMLPGGTKVFSEHLKVPKYIADGILNRKSKKKYSYADLSKKFPTAKYEKILMDPRADEYAKRTADIQLQRNQTMLETIFEAQEMAKGNTQQPMDYSMVDTEQMMARGGMFPYNRNFKVAGYGPQQSSNNLMGMNNDLPIAQDGTLQPDNNIGFSFDRLDNLLYKVRRDAQGNIISEPLQNPIYRPDIDGPLVLQNLPYNYTQPLKINQQTQPVQSAPAPQQTPAPSQGSSTPQQTPGAPSPSTFPTIPAGQSQLWTADQTQTYGTDDYIRPDYSNIPGYNPNYNIGDYQMDITVPNLQRKRQDQQGYGKQPYLTDPYMNVFKATFPEYFESHPNFNKNSRQDWTDFQNWHNRESDTLGRQKYFAGQRKFDRVDGYPGAYTMHAPSFRTRVAPPAAATPEAPPATTTPAGTTTAAAERSEPASNASAFSSPSPVQTKRKSKFGISPKLAGTVLDIGLALSDRLRIDHPDYRDLRKYPVFRRFTDFDDQEISQQQAAAIQNVQNSNMPEQAKQAMIANITANAAKQQGSMDLQNQGRYDQWLEGNLNKLQTYMDSNINQQAQDIDRYQQQKARVNFLKDQFNAQKKSRVVNSVRDYLDYLDQAKMYNQLAASEYRINPFTGRINYKGYNPDALKRREQEMAQYVTTSSKSIPLDNGATYYPQLNFIITKDGKGIQLNNPRQSSNQNVG